MNGKNHSRFMCRVTWPLAPLAVLAVLLASCRAPLTDSRMFLLQTEDADVVAAADRLTDAVFSQLQADGALPEGYPAHGHLMAEPDPSDPGVEVMTCAPGSSDETGETRCISLSKDGDFIRVKPVTWQSAAAYMYWIYVAPRSPFARVDLAKDFVALDVFGPESTVLWQPAGQAIRRAAAELGARPFRP